MLPAMRRLYPRGAANRGVCVDANGAMLGPNWLFVERTAAGYRTAPRIASRDVQKVLLIDQQKPDWLYEQGRRIADALNRGEIALAQIYGLRIPIGDIDQRQLKRLATAADLRKAGFNPDEPRIPAGEHGGGEWTIGEDSGSDWADGGDGVGGEGTDNDSNGGGRTIGSDNAGEGADDGDSGGGDSGTASAPVPALRYMGESDASSAMPLVGGRWPAPVGANSNPLFFPAQAEEDENGRSGGLLDDFVDLPIAFRQAMYGALRARLEAIEPGNPALQTLTGPSYSPTQDDIDNLNEALREAQERAGEPPATEWQLGWGVRGVQLELQRLGGQRALPFNAPTIDDFSYDVALSVKSIDLNAPWYANPLNLSRQIDGYVDKLATFSGMRWGDNTITEDQISGRVLDIVVPMNSGTQAQQQAIARAVERARQLDIWVFISPY